MRRMRLHDSTKAGFTLLQLVMSIAAAMILLAGIVALFGRGVQVGSQNFIRVLTTEDARLALERISDTLRNSRNGEMAFWLTDAQEYEVAVLTNVDGSDDNERIRYYMDGLDLVRERKAEDGTLIENNVVTRRVRNVQESEPIFRYYGADGQEIAAAGATALNVKKVKLTLLVDEDPQNRPLQERVETIVIPRGTINDSKLQAVDFWPTRLNFPAPGTETTNNIIEVTITNPNNPVDTRVEYVTVQDMNDLRLLATYDDGHEVHVNYQSVTYEGDSAGWYAWVGPILLGRSGEQVYTTRDKISAQLLCAATSPGITLQQAHTDTFCPKRSVSQGSLSNTYRPILTYRLGDGTLHYVDEITFTN